MDGTTGAGVVLDSDGDGMTLGYGTVVSDGTTGAGAEASAGIVGIDGTTGAGEATVDGAGTTGATEVLVGQMLGVLHLVTVMQIKAFMEIEVMHITQVDADITMVVER